MFGLVAGLSVWDDWLILPYLAAAAVILLVGCWSQLRGRASVVVVAGFLIGSFPLLLDNLTASVGKDSLSVFRWLNAVAGRGTLAEQLHAGIVVGIPLAGGLCPPSNCSAWQAWWGVLYLPLLLAAAALAVIGLRRVGTPRLTVAVPDQPDEVLRIRYLAQLATAAAAVFTVIAYVRNPAAVAAPLESARYLSVISVSLPAVLWPVWRAVAGLPRRATAPLWLGASAVLVALTAAMVMATGALIARVPAIRNGERQEQELADSLEQQRIHEVYAPYGTCARLMFLARERIVCAALNENLTPGDDRYPPYRYQVRAANRPAFVFPVDRPADRAFQAYLSSKHISAPRSTVAGFHVYQPTTNLEPPLDPTPSWPTSRR